MEDEALGELQRRCIVADAEPEREDLAAQLDIVRIEDERIAEILGGLAQVTVVERHAAGEIARGQAVGRRAAADRGGQHRGLDPAAVGKARGRLGAVAASGDEDARERRRHDQPRPPLPTRCRRPKSHEGLQSTEKSRRCRAGPGWPGRDPPAQPT